MSEYSTKSISDAYTRMYSMKKAVNESTEESNSIVQNTTEHTNEDTDKDISAISNYEPEPYHMSEDEMVADTHVFDLTNAEPFGVRYVVLIPYVCKNCDDEDSETIMYNRYEIRMNDMTSNGASLYHDEGSYGYSTSDEMVRNLEDEFRRDDNEDDLGITEISVDDLPEDAKRKVEEQIKIDAEEEANPVNLKY